MKVIKDEMATLKRQRRVTVELQPGDELLVINDRLHYRLGYPLMDVVPGHVVKNLVPVSWCCIDQRWTE